jgi:hypothetical protein
VARTVGTTQRAPIGAAQSMCRMLVRMALGRMSCRTRSGTDVARSDQDWLAGSGQYLRSWSTAEPGPTVPEAECAHTTGSWTATIRYAARSMSGPRETDVD